MCVGALEGSIRGSCSQKKGGTVAPARSLQRMKQVSKQGWTQIQLGSQMTYWGENPRAKVIVLSFKALLTKAKSGRDKEVVWFPWKDAFTRDGSFCAKHSATSFPLMPSYSTAHLPCHTCGPQAEMQQYYFYMLFYMLVEKYLKYVKCLVPWRGHTERSSY